MASDDEPLLTANARFYQALSLADLPAMERLWVHSDDALCTHPGGAPLVGWPAIRESWQAIFQQQGPMHIWPSSVQVRRFGQTAEVHCLENVETQRSAGGLVLQVRAVNVFRRLPTGWRLLEHHAGPTQGGAHRLAPFSSN